MTDCSRYWQKKLLSVPHRKHVPISKAINGYDFMLISGILLLVILFIYFGECSFFFNRAKISHLKACNLKIKPCTERFFFVFHSLGFFPTQPDCSNKKKLFFCNCNLKNNVLYSVCIAIVND